MTPGRERDLKPLTQLPGGMQCDCGAQHQWQCVDAHFPEERAAEAHLLEIRLDRLHRRNDLFSRCEFDTTKKSGRSCDRPDP
jgi:hypothetical protein